MRAAISLTLCGLLLGACASNIPPIDVETDLPVAYPDAATPGDQIVLNRVSWRSLFRDPRLTGLIDQALTANRDLEAATARIDEAAAQLRTARADRFPTVDLSASAQTFEGASPVAGGGGADAPSGEFYTVQLGVSAFELDFWGRVRRLEDAARARYLATTEARRAFELSLIAQVADAYFAERETKAALAVAARAAETRRTSLRLATRLYEEGEGSRFEIAEAEVLLMDAERLIADLERDRAQAGNQLRLLLGGDPHPGLPAPAPLEAQTVLDVWPGLPSELLRRRPDLREAELALAAAGADLAAARAALFPALSLTAATGFASPSLEHLFSPDSDFWNLAADLLQPLFDAGRRRAGVDAADARLRVALAEYQSAIQRAFQEVADILAERQRLTTLESVQARGLAAERERLRLARLRFEVGETASLDVLEAERSLLAAEQALITTRRERLANSAALYVALGGAASA